MPVITPASAMPEHLSRNDAPESQQSSRQLARLNELEGVFDRNPLLLAEPARMEKFDAEFQRIFGVRFCERKQLRALLENATTQSVTPPDLPDVNGSGGPESGMPEAWL